MKRVPENKAREERIANKVTVDAYGSEEALAVLELIDEDENLGGDFFVRIEWMGRKMGVPLPQLKPLKVNKETKQAFEDWQYWKARGYQF